MRVTVITAMQSPMDVIGQWYRLMELLQEVRNG